MSQEQPEKESVATVARVANIARMTTIPNSINQHNIYTYSTDVDTTQDIKRPGFFNAAFSFLTVGDIVRVFQADSNGLNKFYEFIVMSIDKNNRKVKVAIVSEHNLQNKIIE